MRIAYLPLDSRPCNSLFPVQLAAWCGHKCLIPEKQEMDDFTVPAPFEASEAFLWRTAPQADALVLSVDHLCFGSLLGSRNDSVPQPEALRRLELAEKLHAAYPDLPIYAYSVVMRSSISTLYAADVDAYRAMTEYSVYTDRAAQTGDPEDAARAQDALSRLPADVLNRYRLARERNHAVNRRCVELAASGVFAALALLQEDAETYGFHKGEQRALLALKKQLNAPNIWLHNGADEGGALAVMKAIAARKTLPPVAVRYLGWPDGDFVARYEDRPFRENVEDSLSFAGMNVSPDAVDVLAVCCPPDGAQTDWEKPECAEGYAEQARQLASLAAEGKRVYLLDVTRANGGSPMLARALYNQSHALPLAGYSAWNTASNALGTLLAQLMSDQLAGQVNEIFLWERLLDDLVYQGAVREKLYGQLEAIGEDPFHLADSVRAVRLLDGLMAQYLRSEPMFQSVPEYAVSLPWARTFECHIQVNKER